MHILVADAETFYDSEYSLSKMTTEAYVRDPRFELIGMGLRNADNSARVWLEVDQFRAWIETVDPSEIALIAHHAQFDGLILHHHFNFRPRFWFDTLSMANAVRPHDRHSLGKLAELEGIGHKGTEVVQAKGKRRRDFTPAEWAQYGVYCLNDCDLEYKLYEIYAPHFSVTELRVMDTTIRMFTEPVLTMNLDVLEKHHASEIVRKQALLTKACVDKKDLMSNDRFAKLLLEYGVEPPLKVSEAKTKAAQERGEPGVVMSFAFAKSDSGMKELLDHPNDDVRWLAEARVGVKSTIEETRSKRYIGITERGLWPVYLHYSKPHTHRWSGGDKANPQNLKRGGVLRDAVEAAVGFKIIVADSAQIEARKLAWVAGQADLVQAFAEGRDIYSEFASEVYNRPVDRKRKEIVDGKETSPDFLPGFVAKTCILGLGYQMGWPKFAGTMLAGAMGGPPVQFGREMLEQMQIDYTEFISNPYKVRMAQEIPTRLSPADMIVHCIVCEALVKRYRDKNKAIVGFWEIAERAIRAMFEGKEMAFGTNDIFVTAKEKIVLPSGLVLQYPDLRYDIRNAGKRNESLEWTYWNGNERSKIYGGLLTENLDQAASRDIVAEQMVAYVETGRRIAMCTHDEIVGVATDQDAPVALHVLLEIMHRAPLWVPGLPLAAEGGIGQRYGDAK